MGNSSSSSSASSSSSSSDSERSLEIQEIVDEEKWRSWRRSRSKEKPSQCLSKVSRKSRSHSLSRSVKKSTLCRLKKEKSVGKHRGCDPDHQHSAGGENLLRAQGILAKAIWGHCTHTALAPSRDPNHRISQNGAGRKRQQWKSSLQFVLHILYLQQLLVTIRAVSCNSNNTCSYRFI